MKRILWLWILGMMTLSGFSQSIDPIKKPTVGLHFHYNDFETPWQIKTNGLGKTISNQQWNKPQKMQGGFGIDYFQGITQKIDLIGTLNASWVNYTLPNHSAYGSSHLLLDINAGAHFKAFTDHRIVNPYLITKVGFSSYKNLKGMNLIPGAGIQFKVFNEIFVNSNFELRSPIGSSLSPQLFYSIGISRNISNKPKILKKTEAITPKVQTKTISVIVLDEATGEPLPFVEVTLSGKTGNVFTEKTNENGKAEFEDITKDEYQISGILNKIKTSTEKINPEDFLAKKNTIQLKLTHNDPRFTLVGVSIDKLTGKPIGNTTVTVNNSTQKSTSFVSSSVSTGEFRAQLESGSDFVIFGKRAGYISNIENISTIGLNRSATLYVKLQLGIEEAKAGKTIVLNKIFFETAKSDLNTDISQDLQKLIQFLQDNPTTKLEIQGHTDNIGSLASNMKLSQTRANSVVEFLNKNGISKDRLIATGLGPNRPVATNDTPAGRAQNRRVEMKVIE